MDEIREAVVSHRGSAGREGAAGHRSFEGSRANEAWASQRSRRDVGDFSRTTRPKSREARLCLVERTVQRRHCGSSPACLARSIGWKSVFDEPGGIGLGTVSSANVAWLASSSNAHLDSDMVPNAREATGGKRQPHVSRFRKYVTSSDNCCMTNFKRTRCVIYAITQHDSTAENSPRTSITGKNTNACRH